LFITVHKLLSLDIEWC